MFLLWLYELSQAHSFITSFLWYWSQFNLYKSNLKAQTQQLCWVNAANGLLRWNNALSFCVSLRHIVMSIFNSGPFMFLVRLSPRWFSQLLWRIVHVNSRLCTSKPISSHQKEDVDALRTFTGHETHLTLDQKNTIPLAKDHRLVTRQGLKFYFYWVERLVTRQDCNGLAYWVTALPLENMKRTLVASAHPGSSQPLWDTSRNLCKLYLSNFDGSHIIDYDGACREMYACLGLLNFISKLIVFYSL